MYCKHVYNTTALKQLEYLIGTFCIVNYKSAIKELEWIIFNRNILYCKQKLFYKSFLKLKDLIGTFCIVNSITIGAFEVLKYKKAKVELLIFDIG